MAAGRNNAALPFRGGLIFFVKAKLFLQFSIDFVKRL